MIFSRGEETPFKTSCWFPQCRLR